jgi:hypothetical protein
VFSQRCLLTSRQKSDPDPDRDVPNVISPREPSVLPSDAAAERPMDQYRFSTSDTQRPLAPGVLIKEAPADIEIFDIAGRQGDPFVFGKPLRESDHSAGRRHWPV